MRRLITAAADRLRGIGGATDEPPWPSGRLVVVHRGFAITVPEGWLAFDLTARIETQVKRARLLVQDLPASDVAGLRARLVQEQDEGVQILALEFAWPRRAQHCSIGRPPEDEWQHDREFAEALYRQMLSEAERSEVFPPRSVELPSGGAWVLDSTYVSPAHDEGSWQSALYQLEANGGALIECGGPARPKDDWRSIVDTFEFLVGQR